MDSVVRHYLYNNIFLQKDPIPLMGSIITEIFWKEEDAINKPFLRILQDPREILQASSRLKVINSALKINNLDSSMATLCCDIIQKEFFVDMSISEMAQYFRHAVQTLLEKTFEPLKHISAIAFLKEFVCCMWNQTLQDNYTQPIPFIGIMDISEFDGDVLIEEINNFMNEGNPLIHSLKVYFLRELRHKGLSIDDLQRFCVAHQDKFPWLSTFKWNDNKNNRFPFNPYWKLPEYCQVESAFKESCKAGNKAPFQAFMQQLLNSKAFRARIALIGLIISRLLYVDNEQGAEHQAVVFLKVVRKLNNLSTGYKQTIEKMLSNNQSLLRSDNATINNNLCLKSVIYHIIALHASIQPDSNPLAAYFHKIETCQDMFILATASNNDSLILNAVDTRSFMQMIQYACICGYRYIIASYVGNQRLDKPQIIEPVKSKGQPGYIGEQVNNMINHSVRSMPTSSYRILHLIVHALIGTYAHSPATLTFLCKHNQTINDSEQYCLDHIINDWTVLRQILYCSDEDLALLFHSLLTEMTLSPPPMSMLKTMAEREDWEIQFTQNYVFPLVKNVPKTIMSFRMALDAASTDQDNNSNIIDEIDQAIVINNECRLSKLPRLWRKIDIVNFNSFHAYYNRGLPQYQIKYPFLAVFFKYFERLEIIKNLWQIVQFVKILHSRLSYRITRKDAEKMTFDEFINMEANRTDLYKMFQKFEDSWNSVIDKVDRYICHELNEKPVMNRSMPIIMGLIEAKDPSFYLCAILEYLIDMQNNFLRDVMTIPGSCKSLKFLEQHSFDAEEGISTTTIETPNQYSIRLLTLNQACIDNIIIYDREELDGIHMFSQRNLEIGCGLDVTYDLQKIEIELARQLVFEKVYIDKVDETSLYLPPFSYHMELIQVSLSILGDIRDLIPQEQIPPEQAELLIGSPANLSYAFLDTSLDNPSEILSSLEILLCFIKRISGGNGESFIKDYINQWSTLSRLNENDEFRNLLNLPLKLKHIISLYELIEGQVANLTIEYTHDKYKEKLTSKQPEEIENLIDFETKQPAKIVNGKIEKFSAEVFATALKRFIYRFLQNENQKETDPLYLYICEPSLHFWPPAISELKNLDESFPKSLCVNQAYKAYKFVEEQIGYHKKMVSSREQQVQNQLNNP
ncbi:e3 ubiquitin-protein ligase [Gigaspora margarita]|uniref:E3 ubiquitin-protein ligase n=1 Tax=Gigaspora margarita TaxID=4874 RepID=A0A8H4B0U4_GIGMA|nr:e3 ubiquitin-protein ligase [Gigaspora margarita]